MDDVVHCAKMFSCALEFLNVDTDMRRRRRSVDFCSFCFAIGIWSSSSWLLLLLGRRITLYLQVAERRMKPYLQSFWLWVKSVNYRFCRSPRCFWCFLPRLGKCRFACALINLTSLKRMPLLRCCVFPLFLPFYVSQILYKNRLIFSHAADMHGAKVANS